MGMREPPVDWLSMYRIKKMSAPIQREDLVRRDHGDLTKAPYRWSSDYPQNPLLHRIASWHIPAED